MMAAPTTFRQLAVGAVFRFPDGGTVCRKVSARKAQALGDGPVAAMPFRVPGASRVLCEWEAKT